MCVSAYYGVVAQKLCVMRAERVLTGLEGAVYAGTVMSCDGEALLSLETFLEGSESSICSSRFGPCVC